MKRETLLKAKADLKAGGKSGGESKAKGSQISVKAKENQANGKSGKGKPLPQISVKADTRAELARVAGVSHDTIAKGKLVAEHADEATKKRLRENQISVHRGAGSAMMNNIPSQTLQATKELVEEAKRTNGLLEDAL